MASAVTLADRFSLAAAPERVRAVLADVAGVVACIPGAAVTANNGDGSYAAAIGVQYGETGVRIGGTVRVDRPSDDRATVRAEGQDGAGTVRAQGEIRVALGQWDGSVTPVDVEADFTFGGVLAPLARSATRIVGPQLLRSFGRCLASKVAPAS